jgi:hypothetical protein
VSVTSPPPRAVAPPDWATALTHTEQQRWPRLISPGISEVSAQLTQGLDTMSKPRIPAGFPCPALRCQPQPRIHDHGTTPRPRPETNSDGLATQPRKRSIWNRSGDADSRRGTFPASQEDMQVESHRPAQESESSASLLILRIIEDHF